MREAMNEIEAQAAVADRAAASNAVDGARMTAVESDVAEVKAQIATMTGALNELLRRVPASADAPAAAAMPNVEPTTIFDETGLESEELQEVAADDCATITNGNVARLRPDIEACAKVMAAGGAGLNASAVPAGGLGVQRSISDLSSAPLLERFTRGSAGAQGSLVPVLSDSNQVVFMQASGEVGTGRKQVSEKQLLERIPNAFVFMDAVAFRKRWLVSKGYLQGGELLAYERVFAPQLFRLAKQFVGGYSLVSPVQFQRNWQVFLVFEREVIFEIYEQRLSFADLPLHLHGSLMHEAMARAAVRNQGSGAGGAGAASAVGAAAGGAGAARGTAGLSHAAYLATQVPEQHREACCVPFWRTGRCNRSECTHAATGHKCLRCGSTAHGGGQCKA